MKITQHGQISEVQKNSIKSNASFKAWLMARQQEGAQEVVIHCELLPVTKAVKITAQTATRAFFADIGPRGKITDILTQRINSL